MKKLTFEELIQLERNAQDEKWGIQDHKPELWLSILMEEVGELASAILYNQFQPEKQRPLDLENELIQVTAVAKVMWESGKRNGWL